MSLKSIGSGLDLFGIGGDTLKELNKLGAVDLADEFNKIFNQRGTVLDVGKMIKFGNINKDVAQAAIGMSKFKDEISDVETVTNTLGSSLSTAGKGLFAGIKSFIFSPAGIIAGLTAVVASIQYYEKAQERAIQRANASMDSYTSTGTEISNIETELDGISQKMSEIESKGTLSITDKVELETLKAQTAELEKQLAVRTKQEEIEGRTAKNDTIAALKKKANVSLLGGHNEQRLDMIQTATYYIDHVANLEKKASNNNLDKYGQQSLDDLSQRLSNQYTLLDGWYNKLAELGGADVLQGDELALFSSLEQILPKLEKALGITDLEKQRKALTDIFKDDTWAEDQQKAVDKLRNNEDINLEADFSDFTAACKEAGIEADQLLIELQSLADGGADAMTILEAQAKESFEATTSSLQKAIDDTGKLQSLMSESYSGKGMSQESVANFKELYGDNAQSALEKTANGYRINEKALQELQRQQNANTKSDYLSQMADQQKALGLAMANVAKARHLGQDDSAALNNVSVIQSQIEQLKELQYQYEASNSAFNKWQNASSGGESGDMYDSIRGGMNRAEELYKAEKVGTNEFKAMVDLMSHKDLSNATVPEIVKAYEEAHPKMKRYFTDSIEGTAAALKDMQKLNEEFAKQNSDGTWEINKDSKYSDKEIADALKIDVEAYQAILRNTKDYGLSIDIDQPKQSLEELKNNAIAAKEALNNANFSTSGSVELNNSSFIETTEQIEKLQQGMDIVNNSTLDPEVKAERLESMSQIMEFLLAQQADFLESGELKFNITADDLESSISKVNEILSNIGEEPIEINFEANVDEIDAEIQTATNILEHFKNSDGIVNLSIEGATETTNIFEHLQLQKEKMSSPAIMSIDVGALVEIDAELGNAVAKVMEFQNSLSSLNRLEGKKAAGFDVDTSEAQSKVQALAGDMANIDKNIMSTLGLDSGEFDSAIAGIQGTEVNVEAGVNLDRTQLDAVLSGINSINVEAVISKAGDIPADEEKSLIYNASIVGNVPKDEKYDVQYTAHIVNPLKNESRTVTYTVKVNGSIPGGSSHANGTAHAQGTVPSFKGSAFAMGASFGNAYAGGQWGISRNETALLGEQSPEIVVRNGRFFTVGDQGAEMFALKKNDIIFSGKQSEELMKYGKVKSGGGRGHTVGGASFAEGTVKGSAYSTGVGGLGLSGNGSSASTTKKSTTTSSQAVKAANNTSKAANNTSKAADNAAKASDDALKKLTDVFDFISIQMDRYSRESKHAEDAISRAVGIAGIQSANSTAIAKIQEELANANRSASQYRSYLDEFANQSGLSTDLQAKIQNGSLDISQLDEDTKTKVSHYDKYYSDFLKALDLVSELADKEKSLAVSRLKNVDEFYQSVQNAIGALVDYNDAQLGLSEALGESAVSNTVKSILQNNVDQQLAIQKEVVQKLAAYQKEFQSLIDNRHLTKQGEIDYFEGLETVRKFEAELLEVNTTLIEFQDKLRKVDYTRIQQSIDSFGRAIERLSNGTSLKEARNQHVTREDYQLQIDERSKNISANYNLRNNKIAEQNIYAISSERYQQLAKEIADIDSQIYDSFIEIETLRDKVFETEFKGLDDRMDDLSFFNDELDTFRKLLNVEGFFGKSGEMSSDALANIALIGQAMSTEKQKIADYTTGIKKLDAMLKSGLISTTEYTERQREFLKGIQDSSLAVNDYKKELVDMYLKQIELENKALIKSIDLRKEALTQLKKYQDFADKVHAKSRDVNSLSARINALQGVNNDSSRAELKRLIAERDQAQKDLNKIKSDNAYDTQQTGYDKMKDNANRFVEDLTFDVQHSLEKQNEIVQNQLAKMVNSYSDAFGTIKNIINSTGIVGSQDFNSIVNNIGTPSGASNIASSATQSQNSISTSGSVIDNINTSNTSSASVNTSSIESEIAKSPNVTNRLVAELTATQTSVSLQEGQSTSVGINIRPSDANNKTVRWTSSNPSVATCSNGTIRAISPGYTQIIVTTTDGSNRSVSIGVNVTPKPVPPPPAPTTPSTPAPIPVNNSGGDGVARVGDPVTFSSGRYYSTPQGTGASGARNMGGQVHITRIMSGSHGYHISTGNKLGSGDLGWLKLSQLKGYASGTRKTGKELALFDDTKSGKLDLGSEVLMTKHGMLKQMDGDTIFSKAQTDNLWKLSQLDPVSDPSRLGGGKLYNVNNHKTVQSINLNFDHLLEVNGNVDAGFMEEARKHMPKLVNEMGRLLIGEMRKM